MSTAVVFGPERAWRLSCASALRIAGYQVRMASSQAELAKALRDGTDLLLLIDPMSASAIAACEPRARMVWRELAEDGACTVARALATGPTNQPISSA